MSEKREDAGSGSGESAANMASTQARKMPPPEKPEASQLRRTIVLSFWAVIVFLGIPMWWQTTSIYRAKLPIQEMLSWSEGQVSLNPMSWKFYADRVSRSVNSPYLSRSGSLLRRCPVQKQKLLRKRHVLHGAIRTTFRFTTLGFVLISVLPLMV